MNLLVCLVLLMGVFEGGAVKVYEAPIPTPEPEPTSRKVGISSRKPEATRISNPSTSSAFSSTFQGAMEGMWRVEDVDVECGRSGMAVELHFTSEFPGIVYSKGHYQNPDCVYVKGTAAPSTVYRFTVPADRCGTESTLDTDTDDPFLQNTIIIQNDQVIQEVWDEARNIRCSWRSRLQKMVNFEPFKVYEPQKVGVQLDARAINTLMDIEKREVKDDQASARSYTSYAPTGYVHVGDDVSLVMYVQDATVDANVLTCNASTAREQVALTDGRGCLLRPDLITPFAKTRRTNGVEAGLMLYSYLKAFNIGESPEFLISCELEICDETCSDVCGGGRRKKRSHVEEEEEEEEVKSSSSTRVILQKEVIVVKKEDEGRQGGGRGRGAQPKTKLARRNTSGCILDNSLALLALALLMTLVSSLGVLSAVLGHKLWALRAEIRKKGVL